MQPISRFLMILAFAGAASGSAFAQTDPDLFSGMKARSIGPAGMSGRVPAVEAVISDPNIIYVGAAAGGVWKSENGGITWDTVFDKEDIGSIGSISVFQPNPDIVWVGTGEGNPRNSISVGRGIYKSLDGGKSWKVMGLQATERIHRVVLHPTNPDIAYAAAMGRAWGENEERGVYKTTDGGETWEKVLYVNERTGVADLVIDPSNPNKLIAAMWEYRRWPWGFKSGGEGSGLYMTVDGGKNWKRFTEDDGLPKGNLGRIGVGFSHNHPDVVYAIVEAEKSALVKSSDGGHSWTKVNEDINIASRPFYYADIRVDPEMPNRVYLLQSATQVSDDGGKSFSTLIPFSSIHPDHHGMWINPEDGRHIIESNDGGVAISRDRGATWRFVHNLPFAQFYHIAVDNDLPYNVYGGMQDNGSWRGPSEVWENGGIRNFHWQEVGFGDGFDVQPDPEDSMQGYAMSQGGSLVRWNQHTGERKSIRPSPPDPDTELRFNWDAALALDPFDPATIYYGSQFVHKSTDRGQSWTIISDDLTTNNPEHQKQGESGGLTLDVTAAENFTTILAIAPSPLEQGVIWVGTDDGRVHITRDGGGSWTSIEGRMRGGPDGMWVPRITPSPHDASVAFIVMEDHRRSNWNTYAFRVENYGRNWTNLATGEIEGFAHVLEQDPVDPDLLFLGTEFGLYVSLNGGGNWTKWRHGVPPTPVKDIAFQMRENDLVMATHGRAAFVLDDISGLRNLSEADFGERLKILSIPAAQQYRVRQTAESRFPGNEEFRGQNEAYGALITWVMSGDDLIHPDEEKERARKAAKKTEKPSEEAKKPANGKPGKPEGPQVEIQVRNADGELIRTMKVPAYQGINRASWNLRPDALKLFPGQTPSPFAPGGPEVMPGSYEITLKYGDAEARQVIQVLPDPRIEVADADRQAKQNTIARAIALREVTIDAIQRIADAANDIDAVLAKATALQKDSDDEEPAEDDPVKMLMKNGNQLKKGLDALEERLWTSPRKTKGIPKRNRVADQINNAFGALGSSWDAPTPAQMDYLRKAELELERFLPDLNRLFAEDVAAFRTEAEALDLRLLQPGEPLSVPGE